MTAIKSINTHIKKHFPSFVTNNTIPILEPIDNRAKDILSANSIDQVAKKWNPYQIDFLISEANRLLSHCLELRASGQNLEAQAIEIVLEHKFAIDELDIQSQLLDLQKIENGYKLHEALTIQNETQSYKLPDSDFNIVRGTPDSIEDNKKFFTKTFTLNNDWLQLKREYLNNIQHQRTIEGSALNINQRFKIVKDFFEIALEDLYQILISLHAGVTSIFSHKTDFSNLILPEVTNNGYLLKVHKYINKVNENVQQIKQKEQDFSLHLHITELKEAESKNKVTFLTNELRFKSSALNSGIAKFTIPENIFDDFSNVRLQGLEIFLENEKATTNTTNNIPFTLTPPKSDIWDRQKIYANAFTKTNPGNDNNYVVNHLLTNTNPIGEWVIECEKLTDTHINQLFPQGLTIALHLTGDVK